MTEVFLKLNKFYNLIIHDLPDPRSKNYPFIASPWTLLTVMFFYLYFCKHLGPRFMKNREAFQLKSAMILYNSFQVIVSAWLFVEGCAYAWPGRYRFFCEPPGYSSDPDDLHLLKITWCYYTLKVIELLDTVFFVLRKKTSQISFLHLYHHSGMLIGTHIAAKYVTGGHLALLGQANTFVHAVMYSYYLFTTIVSNEKYVWWKKHITQLQIVQFLFLTCHTLPTLAWKDCDYPVIPRILMAVQYVFMLCLFTNFYIKAYGKKKKT